MALPRNLPTSLILVLLAGCVSAPTKEQPAQQPPAQQAQAMLAQGQFVEAAQAFLRLAYASGSPEREQYQLRAADALIDAGEVPRARSILEVTIAEGVPPAVSALRNLVAARLALIDQQPELALELLPAAEPPREQPLLVRFHRARADALERIGQPLPAAKERIIVDLYLGPERALENRREIFRSLTRASLADLSQALDSAAEPLAGWLRLATLAMRFSTDPATLERALDEWSAAHPGHPASASLVEEIKSASFIDATSPEHVALLLPLDGPFAKAAAAIRDGFLAAWFEDSANAERAPISIWNTAEADIWAVYLDAVGAGADFVVGPLDKPSVNALAGAPELPVDTLALNHSESASAASLAPGLLPAPDAAGASAPAVLYEFALSPEDEAASVAERAWFDGRGSAALLTPAGAWGERVGEAFSSTWQGLGGILATQQRYDSAAPDMSEPVSRLLGVDESKQRSRSLEQFLGMDLEHEPRRRQDIDFIFMAAFAKQARQLRPQIKFHHGSELPVYSTSHIYSGLPNPADDTDIDGTIFGDMPWVLVADGEQSGLRRQIEQTWRETFAAYSRLYAFGVDAYALIPQLGRLRAQPYVEVPGATGWLSVDERNRIERRLTWARFVEGVPVPTETSAVLE